MNRRLLAGAAGLAALVGATACTPREARQWLNWHEQDPAAAQEWLASDEGQAKVAEGNGGGEEHVAASSGGWEAGNCASFADEAAAAGLPWGTFSRIAQRESGCNPNVWVVDSDDDGGGLFGFNYKGSMINFWPNLCGMSKGEVRGNVPLQMECAAAAYRRSGLAPWS